LFARRSHSVELQLEKTKMEAEIQKACEEEGITQETFEFKKKAYIEEAEQRQRSAHDIFARTVGIVIRKPATASDGTAAPAGGGLTGRALLAEGGTAAIAHLGGDIAGRPTVGSPTSAAGLAGGGATEAAPPGSIGAGQPVGGNLAGTMLLIGSGITAAAPLDGGGGEAASRRQAGWHSTSSCQQQCGSGVTAASRPLQTVAAPSTSGGLR
jgi:hypothetical protein